MQVHSSLNSLIQLEKKLEESTEELAKLNKNDSKADSEQQKSIKKDTKDQSQHEEQKKETFPKAEVKSAQTPIAYSVDGNSISVQNTQRQTVIDITA